MVDESTQSPRDVIGSEMVTFPSLFDIGVQPVSNGKMELVHIVPTLANLHTRVLSDVSTIASDEHPP